MAYDPSVSWSVQGQLSAWYKTGQIDNVNARFFAWYLDRLMR